MLETMLTLKERDFEGFFQAPFHAYGDDSLFVSAFKPDLKRFLDEKKNPLFQNFGTHTYFTAYRKGKPVGRLTAHIHQASNRRYGWNRSYFGYFDCANDPYAARELLGAAEDWGRKQGCDEIWGNFNLTAMQQIGVMTGGFEGAPYTDMVYNPPHIPKLLEQNGYKATFPMTTWDIDLSQLDPETILKDDHRKLFSDPDFSWSTLNKKEFPKQIRDCCSILNDGFDQNPMFVPVSEEEFLFQAKDMMLIIDERLSSIVSYRGEAVGILICIPDLNPLLKDTRSQISMSTPLHFLKHRMNRKRAVMIFKSVRRAMHNRGLAATMLYKNTIALKEAGYTSVGGTWIWDENPSSLKGMIRLGAKPLNRLHLFNKSLRHA